ncbi:MAG: type II toxin-antitoxin system death-on-curing family toxin [Parcubacteria group bacterium]|jgi:death-on-curing family protein
MIKRLTIIEIEFIAHAMARETLAWNEPIPDFSTRYPGKLESCLAMPFQKFSRKNLYEGLIGKAAIMFYLMIKNHPFQNGNKRIAVTTLLLLLYKNGKWISASNETLYRFAVLVAQSPAELKKEIVILIENFLEKYVKDAK